MCFSINFMPVYTFPQLLKNKQQQQKKMCAQIAGFPDMV